LFISPSIIQESNSGRVGLVGVWHIQGRAEEHARFCWGNPMEGYNLEDNIKLDVEETGWKGIGWIDLVQDFIKGREFQELRNC
jgi:hypothetical protein